MSRVFHGVKWRLVVVALACQATFGESAAQASEVLRPALAKIASAVSQVLQGQGAESVSIGQFNGPAALGASAGPGIQKILAEEFERIGIKVKKFGAPVGVHGEYLYTGPQGAEAGDFKQIRLAVTLTNTSGQPLTTINQDVQAKDGSSGGEITEPISITRGKINIDTFTRGADAAALLGVTWDFEKSGLGLDIDKDAVLESFRNPTANVVTGTAVRSSPTSPFFLEVLIGNQLREIRLEEGQPVVELNKGETFELRFTNRAAFDVILVTTLDGVNSFAFSKERKPDGGKFTRFVVARNTSLILKGWHITHQTAQGFKVTDFSDSAAALVGSTSGLGMITVVVSGTWKDGETQPPNEPQVFKNEILADEGAGIGLGEEVRQNTQADREKREFGVVRSIITVRYSKPSGQAD